MRSYAWGSRTAIAELCGRKVPSDHPEAELWLGAHPADPARVVLPTDDTVSLLEVLDSDPHGHLGTPTVERFGARLPFLLKLLAAEEPLSLQAHPSARQAAEGFAREDSLGLAIDSPIRNYKDASHKPELVVALTRFEALAGFREPHRTGALLEALHVPELEPYLGLLAGQPDSGGLRALFTTWITLPPTALLALLPASARRVRGLPRPDRRTAASSRKRSGPRCQLAEFYPGDAGVLASLLLNRVTLEPGDGLFLAAGNLHAYLHGMGVEIMANSDNVLRGGLTPKHVDVPELLRVLDFGSASVPILAAESVGPFEWRYRTPAPEFALSRVELGPGDEAVLAPGGPQILLCTNGAVSVECDGGTVDLDSGDSVWLSHSDPESVVRGRSDGAQVFRARLGELGDDSVG